jgi:hypothetical protein
MRNFGLGLGLALCATACADKDVIDISDLRDAVDRSQVSLHDTVAIAEAAMPGGVAIKGRLIVGADPVYDFGAVVDDELTDVRIDSVSGEVISTTAMGAFAVEDCPGAISLAERIAAGEAAVEGAAVQAAPDDDGDCNYEILVLAGATVWEVKIGPDGALVEPPEVADDTED